jgi:hypothetical protein
MKKIITNLVKATVIGLLGLGCSNFLNKQPNAVETNQTFFKTADQANRALTGVYDGTARYNTQEMDEWVFGDICSDDAEKGGEGPADAADMDAMKHFNAPQDCQYLKRQWPQAYEGVFRANQVINNVPKISMDEKLRARYVNEAKFLRALYYFRLVRLFGGVPIVTTELQRSEYCMAQSPIEDCWKLIEQDLKDAADTLPEKSAYAASDMGRATKGAANAFLAKVSVYQKKWQQAKERTDLVINSAQYKLEKNYTDIWALAHKNGDESIYEFQHTWVPDPDWADGNEGTITTIYTTSRSLKNASGWGYICPTDNYKAEFETDANKNIIDPRYKWSVYEDGDTVWKGTPWEQIANTAPSPTKRMNRKTMYQYMANMPEMSNAPNNWIFMRYADLLLWNAEANCELDQPTPALASLNLVRKRVNMADVTTTEKAALRKAIYHERRVELGFEGHRLWDILRTDRALELLGGAYGYTEKKRYFPIPQTEIDVCSKLTQNDYYK